MPFMRGPMPLRRTLHHLKQGKMILRDNVAVFMLGYHLKPHPEQQGAADFKFWHWSQLQFKNPHIQLIKLPDYCITPFALTILRDGRDVLFDLENKTKDEIVNMIQGTLGKTPLVVKREFLEKMQDRNPADFGSDCKRHCICEVQGQRPCPSLLPLPEYMRARWRWNHNTVGDGRDVLFDLENKTKDEIVNMIQGTLGKTPLVVKREFLEKMQDRNPADFGSDCKRHCICEVQGQRPCPSLLPLPEYMRARWRWNHNTVGKS